MCPDGLDVQYRELDEIGDPRQRRKRGTPVHLCAHLDCLERIDVQELKRRPYTRAYRQRGNVGERTRLFERNTDKVVFANRGDLDRVGEFIVGRI